MPMLGLVNSMPPADQHAVPRNRLNTLTIYLGERSPDS
jgi:hypothetical protein